jgi:hypothetical protein
MGGAMWRRHALRAKFFGLGAASVCLGLIGASQAMAQGLPVMDGVRGVADGNEQAKPGAQPFSQLLGMELPGVPAVVLEPVDNTALYAEDVANYTNANYTFSGPKRVGIFRDVADFDWNVGQWLPTPDGGWLWTMDVISQNSFATRLHFTDVDLPTGVSMTVYAPNDIEGTPWPYTGKGPYDKGDFWARTAFGDTARIEVYVPAGVFVDQTQPMFQVRQLSHDYLSMKTGLPTNQEQEVLGCHNDVNCFAWANEAAGVAHMRWPVGGGFVGFCTGSLLNAQNGDLTPYFITARHCLSTQTDATNLETYWFFQTASCNGAAPGLPSGANRADNATLLSTGIPSDFCLLRIEGTIRRDLWWQGWDANGFADGQGCTGIHHPDGSWKRISFATTGPINSGCNIAGITSRVTGVWNSGTTEPGSSGSPLFDNARRVRGTLSCANGVCASTGNARFHYGRFETSYPNIAGFLSGGSDDLSGNNACAGAFTVANGWYFDRVVKSTAPDWYKITVAPGASVRFYTSFTHAWGDIDVQLFNGCGGPLLASSTGTSGVEDLTWTNPNAFAVTVYANVYLFNDTRNQYSMFVGYTLPGPPANDLCGNATTLANGQSLFGTIFGAGQDASASCVFTQSPDVWYSFTANCAGTVTFDTEGSTLDTVMSVFAGCGGTQLFCNDDFNPPNRASRITFTTTPFQTYRIRIGGFGGGQGNFNIRAQISAPSNDNCFNAVALPSGTYAFDSCGSTTDGPDEPDLCLNAGDSQVGSDFWVVYYPECSGIAIASTIGSSFDTKLAIYNPFCPTSPNSAIACSDDAFGTLQSYTSADVSQGVPVLVRVGGFNGAAGAGQLALSCVPLGVCDSIDFNNDELTPDSGDLDDFIAVLAGGPLACSNFPNCNDVDFNNDGLAPDSTDLDAFISRLAGGECLLP